MRGEMEGGREEEGKEKAWCWSREVPMDAGTYHA